MIDRQNISAMLLKMRTDADLIQDLITRGVLSGDDALHTIAAELLSRFDVQGIQRLIRVAQDPDNPSGHRVRALLAIRHYGVIPTRGIFDDLFFLARDADEGVAAIAGDLIRTMREAPDISSVFDDRDDPPFDSLAMS